MRGARVAELNIHRRDRTVSSLCKIDIHAARSEYPRAARPQTFDQGFTETLVLPPNRGYRSHSLYPVGHRYIKTPFVITQSVAVPMKGNVAVGTVVCDHGSGDIVQLNIAPVAEHKHIVAFV